MGKRAVNTAEVVDDSFAGLVAPIEKHAMGRPDIEQDRPGDLLVSEVVRFEAEGGFRELARKRDEERALDEASTSDSNTVELPDFGVRLPAGDSKDHDISGESSQD